MPFDPALPAAHSDLDSEVVRNQLNALNAKIEATPAGPPGPPGPPGPGTVASVTGGVVDDTDPANPVIRTDVVGGTPQLIFGGGIKPGGDDGLCGIGFIQ